MKKSDCLTVLTALQVLEKCLDRGYIPLSGHFSNIFKNKGIYGQNALPHKFKLYSFLRTEGGKFTLYYDFLKAPRYRNIFLFCDL
jgi:hypothetical protein